MSEAELQSMAAKVIRRAAATVFVDVLIEANHKIKELAACGALGEMTQAEAEAEMKSWLASLTAGEPFGGHRPPLQAE
jgi:hypothetical protein